MTTNKPTKMELATVENEERCFDLTDVLDIIKTDVGKDFYTIVFFDGEIWNRAKIKKTTYNKFEKLKEKRGQK